MDYPEFSVLADATVSSLLDRIPAGYREGLEALLAGGEQRMAVTDLMHSLIDDHVAVTSGERDDIRHLLEYLGEPTDQVGRLTIES